MKLKDMKLEDLYFENEHLEELSEGWRKYIIMNDEPHFQPGVFPNARRIKACRAIPEIGIYPGDVGGYIDGDHNLSHDGACWVFDSAVVAGNASVTHDSVVRGFSEVSGEVRVRGNVSIEGFCRINGDAWISSYDFRKKGVLVIDDRSLISGDAFINDVHDFKTIRHPAGFISGWKTHKLGIQWYYHDILFTTTEELLDTISKTANGNVDYIAKLYAAVLTIQDHLQSKPAITIQTRKTSWVGKALESAGGFLRSKVS